MEVMGLGFGPARVADSGSTDPRYQGSYTATPSSFNLLQGGKPDRGTLNSEFYVAYWFGPRAGVRAGASHEVAEYTRSEEHTSELQSHLNLVCRLLLEKKKYH